MFVNLANVLVKLCTLGWCYTISSEKTFEKCRHGWWVRAHDTALLAANGVGNMVQRLIHILF
jgi:hypothetical protein